MLVTDALQVFQSKAALARWLGVRPARLSQHDWRDVVPAVDAMRIAAAYPQVPLRPHDYPPRERAGMAQPAEAPAA